MLVEYKIAVFLLQLHYGWVKGVSET